MKSKLLITTLIFATTACALNEPQRKNHKKPTDGAAPQGYLTPPIVTGPATREFRSHAKALAAAQVGDPGTMTQPPRTSLAFCKSQENCPDEVAFLTTVIDSQVRMCSGSLIAPNVIMTNSHCIADEFKDGRLACSQSMTAHFATTPRHEGRAVSCARILGFSEFLAPDGARLPDYAFIELTESLDRKPLTLSYAGFTDLQEVKVARVNPLPDDLNNGVLGEIDPVTCRSVMRTAQQPQFDQPLAPLVSIADCELTKGNSGGVILDAEGNARGIIQSSVDKSGFKPGEVEQGFIGIGTGTNLSCVPTPLEPARSLPESCAIEISQTANTKKMRLIEQENTKPLQDEINRKHRAWVATNSTLIAWGLNFSQNSAIPNKGWYTPAPRCLTNARQIGSMRSSMKLPQYSRRVMYDRYLRLMPKSEPDRTVESLFNFDPSEFARLNLLSITQAILQPAGEATLTFKNQIKACN